MDDPTTAPESNYRILMDAVSINDLPQVERLLKSGISPNEHPNRAQSSLILAADAGFVEVFKLLLEHGAEVNYEDEGGDTALNCAAIMNLEEVIKLCIEHGANPKQLNQKGFSALDYARKLAQPSTTTLLKSLAI